MALKDITLGQYFPGNSFLHRLDPRSKLFASLIFMTCLFLSQKFFFIFTFSGNMCVRLLFVRDTLEPDVKKLKAVFLAFFDYIFDSPVYNRGQRVNPNPDFGFQFKRRRVCKRAVLFIAIRAFNRFCCLSHHDNTSNRDYG